MPLAFHHVAYPDLAVANPVAVASVEAMIRAASPRPEQIAIDVGAGAGGISVLLARDHGLKVQAIERDPEMASMIVGRAREARVGERVSVLVEQASTALSRLGPAQLIVALGTTFAVPAARGPRDVFEALADHLTPSGHLLWGDLFWKGDPPAPLRQVVGLTGDYPTEAGWRDGAAQAGLTLVAAEITPQDQWDHYFGDVDRRVRDWLRANPDHPDAAGIETRADQIKTTFDFGRPWLGFGLYLLRKG